MFELFPALTLPAAGKIAAVVGAAWLGLVWLGLLVWITRDALRRSDSMIFHLFAVALGLAFLPGLAIYLLFRPGHTLDEEFAEEKRRREFLEKFGIGAGACPRCAHPLREADRFCENCGAAVRTICVCGALRDLDAKFCRECGRSAAEPAENLEKAKTERKKVARKIAAKKSPAGGKK